MCPNMIYIFCILIQFSFLSSTHITLTKTLIQWHEEKICAPMFMENDSLVPLLSPKVNKVDLKQFRRHCS